MTKLTKEDVASVVNGDRISINVEDAGSRMAFAAGVATHTLKIVGLTDRVTTAALMGTVNHWYKHLTRQNEEGVTGDFDITPEQMKAVWAKELAEAKDMVRQADAFLAEMKTAAGSDK